MPVDLTDTYASQLFLFVFCARLREAVQQSFSNPAVNQKRARELYAWLTDYLTTDYYKSEAFVRLALKARELPLWLRESNTDVRAILNSILHTDRRKEAKVNSNKVVKQKPQIDLAKIEYALRQNQIDVKWKCPDSVTVEEEDGEIVVTKIRYEWLLKVEGLTVEWTRKGLERLTKKLTQKIEESQKSHKFGVEPIEDDGWLIGITPEQQREIGKMGENCMGLMFVSRPKSPVIVATNTKEWYGYTDLDKRIEVKGWKNQEIKATQLVKFNQIVDKYKQNAREVADSLSGEAQRERLNFLRRIAIAFQTMGKYQLQKAYPVVEEDVYVLVCFNPTATIVKDMQQLYEDGLLLTKPQIRRIDRNSIQIRVEVEGDAAFTEFTDILGRKPYRDHFLIVAPYEYTIDYLMERNE